MNSILLTETDYLRLHSLVQLQRAASGSKSVEILCGELKRAKVIPSDEMPNDIVTMNSRVRLKEMKKGVEMELSIVYPKDADLTNRKISVLAPVGTAVLGCAVGEVVECPGPQGLVSYKVEEILFQPEAAGNSYL